MATVLGNAAAPEQITMDAKPDSPKKSKSFVQVHQNFEARGVPKCGRKFCAAYWSCCLRRFDNSQLPIRCTLCTCNLGCYKLASSNCDGYLDLVCNKDGGCASCCCPCCCPWVVWSGLCHQWWGLKTEFNYECTLCDGCGRGNAESDCGLCCGLCIWSKLTAPPCDDCDACDDCCDKVCDCGNCCDAVEAFLKD